MRTLYTILLFLCCTTVNAQSVDELLDRFSMLKRPAGGQETREEFSVRYEEIEKVSSQLEQHGEAAIDALVQIMNDRGYSRVTRFGASFSLARIGGERVVDPLITALNDPEMNYAAAWSLGRIGPIAKRATPHLVKIVTAVPTTSLKRLDDFRATQEEAVEAIGRIGHGSPEAIDALTQRLRNRKEDDRDYATARAMSKLGEAGAERLLILAAEHSNQPDVWNFRLTEAYAVIATENFGFDVKALMLKHLVANGDTAGVAVLAVAMIGEPAKADLLKLIVHEDPEVCLRAIGSLSRMNFNASAARRFRNENVENPVSANEVFPIILNRHRLDDGSIGFRFVRAMFHFDFKAACEIP